MSKKVTRRFMQAVFKRGKSEYLPLDYIQEQAAKVVDPDEINRIKPVLAEMADEGLVEVSDEGYKLLKEAEQPFHYLSFIADKEQAPQTRPCSFF